jgi:hypothetical protein
MVGERIKADQERIAALDAKSKPAVTVSLTHCELLDSDGELSEVFGSGDGMTVRMHYKANQRLEQPQIAADLVWASDDYLAASCSTPLEKVKLEPLSGTGYIDLKVKSLLAEPNVYAWNIKLIDGATGQLVDTMPKTRFVLNEQVPVPGVFGVVHEWHQPEATPSANPDAREEAA